MMGYNLNEEELVNDRHYAGDRERERERGDRERGGASGADYPMHRDDDRRVLDRDPRDRDPRLDPRERERAHLAANSRHLVNNSSYESDNVDLIREKEKERFTHSNRRGDRDEYSPHRGNRRVLNMNVM